MENSVRPLPGASVAIVPRNIAAGNAHTFNIKLAHRKNIFQNTNTIPPCKRNEMIYIYNIIYEEKGMNFQTVIPCTSIMSINLKVIL